MITRRKFVLGLSASTLLSGAAKAELSCSAYNLNGIQRCEAGIEIDSVTTAQQKCPNWCWAACIETIFQLAGRTVSQPRIVKKLFNSVTCATASGPQIVNTIKGKWKTDDGETFYADAEALLDLSFGIINPAASAMVAQELAAGRPLINGALGHATVLTAMTYDVDTFHRGNPVQIIVRDPWPEHPNRRELTIAEAHATFFIARVSVRD